MPAGEHRPNEELARYIESRWSNRFSVFCNALRQYPLPITSGAAATVLHGSSPDVLQAVDAYCCSTQSQQGEQQESSEWNESELDLFPRPDTMKSANSTMTTMMMVCSPFRFFKARRLEEENENLSLWPNETGKVVPNTETFTNSNNENDILFSLLDASSQLHGNGHMRSKSSSLVPRSSNNEQQERSAEAKLSVKELQAICASKGLLTRGTKKELIARIHQHNALKDSGALSEQQKVVVVEKPHPQEEHNVVTMSGNIAATSPKRVALTNEELLEHSQRLRTPFRSPSTSQHSPHRSAEPVPKIHRLLATPQEYVAALIKQNRQGGGGGGGNNNSRSAAAATSTTEETTRWPWRILVDNRERIRGAHEHVIKAFDSASVPTVSCTLPCGDFMIGIDVPAGYSARRDYLQTMEGDDSISRLHLSSDVGVNTPAQSLFSIVVERKTTKDLCASIASSRYYEQRRILSASPFRSVVWVVEGSIESLRPDEQRRVLSACASLATVPNFRVVRTRHLAETIVWLRHLSMAHISSLAKVTTTTTRGRGEINSISSSSSSSLLADCAACMEHTEKLRRALRARTTFPRVLMCVRGCSTALATQLASKYGSLLQLWRRLRDYGREACDADEDIRRLSSTQKDVYVRLTEFLLAEEYC
ncbi:DNA repair protein [Trypanosoma theileri]|uniref:Crossover junction endonuclease MUS81 n=1 Tax=Trypanosoma theileri TaxID=67003 RepID=A0A1X0NVZ1_9TRYP|nr:DNA repair protein [Trypanosoma theileri]ORC88781.1 DNA repair protein [Trypanosoma theileri]